MAGQVLDYEAKRIHDAGKEARAYEKACNTVRNLKQEKLPTDLIARAVGWSEEDVLALF